ncbi:hypothetical protein EYC84_001812 [Monilinia fructicola]|nr:hypothetical protein EYC84_001812 [Monilinia fructicola]
MPNPRFEKANHPAVMLFPAMIQPDQNVRGTRASIMKLLKRYQGPQVAQLNQTLQLKRGIVSPTPLPSYTISPFQILTDLLFRETVRPTPVGTGCPGSEFMESILALVKHLFPYSKLEAVQRS